MSFIAPLGIAFWAFMAIAAVGGMYFEYKKRRLELEPLRTAIERGQQLDPAIIERLMPQDPYDSKNSPIKMRLGGIITTASGAGLAIFGVILSQLAPRVFFPMVGAGAAAICVGLGLVLAARALEHRSRVADKESGQNT